MSMYICNFNATNLTASSNVMPAQVPEGNKYTTVHRDTLRPHHKGEDVTTRSSNCTCLTLHVDLCTLIQKDLHRDTALIIRVKMSPLDLQTVLASPCMLTSAPLSSRTFTGTHCALIIRVKMSPPDLQTALASPCMLTSAPLSKRTFTGTQPSS